MEEDTSSFPDPEEAGPDGALCGGGNLSPLLLLDAYLHGIYPCFSPGDDPVWWCPDPRCVLLPDDFHISRRSRRKIAAQNFRLTINCAFEQVLEACAQAPRPTEGDWIGDEIIEAYALLHKHGLAYSVEAWQDEKLVGGLYTVVLKPVLFGESMFHHVTEASRAALCGLVSFAKWRHFTLIDCQQNSAHMLRMGANLWPRKKFSAFLATNLGSLPGLLRKIAAMSEDSPRYAYNAANETWRKIEI